MEQRKFWTGAKIRLLGFEPTIIEDYFESDRCRNIDTVAIDYLEHESSELNRFFSHLAGCHLRELIIEDSELQMVSPTILAEAIVSLEKISISTSCLSAGLTSNQLTSIFEIMAKSEGTKLRDIDFSGNDLSSVSSEYISKSVVMLETANLEGCHLTLDQMSAIFDSITQSTELRLTELSIRDNDNIPPGTYYFELQDAKRLVKIHHDNMYDPDMTDGWGPDHDPYW